MESPSCGKGFTNIVIGTQLVALADGMCCMLELMHRLINIAGPQAQPKSYLDPLFANYTLLRFTNADYFDYIALGLHILGLASIVLLYFSVEYFKPFLMCPYFAMEIIDITIFILLIAYNVGLLFRHGKLQVAFGVGYSFCFLLALLLELYFIYVTFSCFIWMRTTKPQRLQENHSDSELSIIPTISRAVPQFQESAEISSNAADRRSGISSYENPAFNHDEADELDEDIVFDRESIVEPNNVIILKKRQVRFKDRNDSE